MTQNNGLVLLVGAIAAAFVWWLAYRGLGGKGSTRYPFMPKSWASTWRSFVAGFVVILFFFVVASLAGRL